MPFNEDPERKIVFLGSQMGLTPHRQRQIEFLQGTYKDRFVIFNDHSVSVAARDELSRYAAIFCPEGRKFNTPAMAHSHTDRPFWSGCLGLVPVSENSTAGVRLDDLANTGLIVRYAHGDLKSLHDACEQALDATNAERRGIYDFLTGTRRSATCWLMPLRKQCFASTLDAYPRNNQVPERQLASAIERSKTPRPADSKKKQATVRVCLTTVL